MTGTSFPVDEIEIDPNGGLVVTSDGLAVDMGYIHANFDCETCNKPQETNYAERTLNTFNEVLACAGISESDIYQIYKGGNETNIEDGNEDIYDNGNIITENGSIQTYFTDIVTTANAMTVPDGDAFLVDGVVFWQRDILPTSFVVSGNYGSDRRTEIEHHKYEALINGVNYFVAIEHKTGNDPNLWTIMYVKDSTNSIFTPSNDDDVYEMAITGTNALKTVGNITIAHALPELNDFTLEQVKAFTSCHLRATTI